MRTADARSTVPTGRPGSQETRPASAERSRWTFSPVNWVTKRRGRTAVTVAGQSAELAAGHEWTTMRQVVSAYRETRAWARWRTTFRLRRYEARAVRPTQPVLDQLGTARLKAVRDELGSRGKRPAPAQRGLP